MIRCYKGLLPDLTCLLFVGAGAVGVCDVPSGTITRSPMSRAADVGAQWGDATLRLHNSKIYSAIQVLV